MPLRKLQKDMADTFLKLHIFLPWHMQVTFLVAALHRDDVRFLKCLSRTIRINQAVTNIVGLLLQKTKRKMLSL
jgi:hypothetical protein